MLLRKEKLGYAFGEEGKLINHLLYMDDLKVFAKDEKQLDQLIELVFKFSKDVGMEFGMEKCATMVIKRGVKIKSEGITLPDGKTMKEVDQEGYKYLGILEGAEIRQGKMKELIRKEYLRRIKAVASSWLYGGHVIGSVNSWALGVVRYSAGVIHWTKKELKEMDVKTRKILTTNGCFHQKSSTLRLYLKRKEGGKGLISVYDCVREGELGMLKYIKESEEALLKVVASMLEDCETKEDYRKRRETERKDGLRGKKLHGAFLESIEEVADERTWQWLRAGYLAKSTEAFIFAAQEQALRTRFTSSKVDGEEIETHCRVCGDQIETIPHIVSGCKKLAQTRYKTRHDKMGLRVYWELCKKYGVSCTDKWYREIPDEVRFNSDRSVEIWWDRRVLTSTQMEHNQPDVVVLDHSNRECIIIDFSVPWDKNVAMKEDEKLERYRPLAQELTRLYGMKAKVVPVVVGGLGTIPKRLPKFIKQLGIPDVIGGLQTSALIGTSIIIKTVLNL